MTTTGYICKRCGEPSPIGVGYVNEAEGAREASTGLLACPCGYSVSQTEDHGSDDHDVSVVFARMRMLEAQIAKVEEQKAELLELANRYNLRELELSRMANVAEALDDYSDFDEACAEAGDRSRDDLASVFALLRKTGILPSVLS